MVAMREDAGQHPTALAPGGPNAIAVANGIVGDEWTLWIVQLALNSNVTQYNDWLRAGPISSAVLTARLSRLVEAAIMERVPYQHSPIRYSYRLTKRGRDMWPILLAMWAWEQRWVNLPEEDLPRMRHAGCGELFAPLLVCDACGEQVRLRDVRATLGPSGASPRSVPAAVTRRRSRNGARPPGVVMHTMAMIGSRWSVALVGAAMMGACRFSEFEESMGAPPTIVADRLRNFCELGILDQTPNERRRGWVVYRLTAKGRAFYPIVASTVEWGQRWFQAPEGPALRTVHAACGHTFHPRLACDRCGQRLRGSGVQVLRGIDA